MNHPQLGTIARGLSAGLIATLALSLLIIVKQALGVMPQLDPIAILAQAMGLQTAAGRWTLHFLVGVILWGALFPWLDRKMPFVHWINGVLFGSGIWLLLMLMIMPMAGAGLFGLGLGIATPTATLLLHWIYGAVLGGAYGAAVTPPVWVMAVSQRLHHA